MTRSDGAQIFVGRLVGYDGRRWKVRAMWKTTEGVDASITVVDGAGGSDRCIVPIGDLEVSARRERRGVGADRRADGG